MPGTWAPLPDPPRSPRSTWPPRLAARRCCEPCTVGEAARLVAEGWESRELLKEALPHADPLPLPCLCRAGIDPAGAARGWHSALTSDGLTPAAFAALAKQQQALPAAAAPAAAQETRAAREPAVVGAGKQKGATAAAAQPASPTAVAGHEPSIESSITAQHSAGSIRSTSCSEEADLAALQDHAAYQAQRASDTEPHGSGTSTPSAQLPAWPDDATHAAAGSGVTGAAPLSPPTPDTKARRVSGELPGVTAGSPPSEGGASSAPSEGVQDVLDWTLRRHRCASLQAASHLGNSASR